MRYLITGTAGFVGFHLTKRLLSEGNEVLGIDGMTPYYDVKLKESRHAELVKLSDFRPHVCMLEDADRMLAGAREFRPEMVVHLAAQAGVRYSLEHPRDYIDSNVIGTFNVMELCRELKPRHLVVASTSSVYGAAKDFPLAETARADHPLTIYSATKKSAEAIAHCYAHLWDIPTTILRFFTAYGPWGRPDMALFKFVENILAGRPIDVYNHGKMERDFTYIDDLIEAIVRLCGQPPRRGDSQVAATDSTSPVGPYRIVNIGGGTPVALLDFVEEIERALGRKAQRNYAEMQAGDMLRTEASTQFLEALIDFRPATPLSVGVGEFVRWYREYYGV